MSNLAEDVVNAVKEVIDENLDDLLESRELAPIASIILGEKMLDEIAMTPLIYIFADSTDVEDWKPKTDSFVGQWNATHSLSIGVVLEHLDTGELRQNLYRYTNAIIETIIDQYPFDDFWPRGRFQIRYQPVLSRQSRFLGDAVVMMRFQKVAERDE